MGSAFAFGAEAEGADAQPDVAAEQVNPVKKEEGGEVDVDDAGEASGFAFAETEPADDTVQPEASGFAFAAADAEGNEDVDSGFNFAANDEKPDADEESDEESDFNFL